jgi:hypothetical protein
MVLVSSVTCAFRAKALPWSVARVCIAICCSAMMVPTKLVEVAMVAELVTTQNTWHGWAPPVSEMTAFGAVTSVVGDAAVPIWKM